MDRARREVSPVNPRLTTAQLRALQPGDRVSRQLLGVLETAPVHVLTSTIVSVIWPDGDVVKYWRESGTRVNCRGESLREPPTRPVTRSDDRTGSHNIDYATMPTSSANDITANEISEACSLNEVPRKSWTAQVAEALDIEVERHKLTAEERHNLLDALGDDDAPESELLNQCERAGFDARDTATLLVEHVLRRRLPLVGDALERTEAWMFEGDAGAPVAAPDAGPEWCPDCDHSAIDHARGECRACACGHGAHRNAYQAAHTPAALPDFARW